MILYFFNQDTGEFIRERPAALDPLGGKPLIPSNAVSIKPPSSVKNQTPIISKDMTSWILVPDFRGHEYCHTKTKERKRFTLGEDNDGSYVDILNNSFDEIWNPELEKWELPLTAIKSRKYAEIKKGFLRHLSEGCESKLGFKVDATPTDETFLSSVYERMKLSVNEFVIISDFDNNIQTVNASDFKKLLIEVGNFIQLAFERKWELRNDIEKCTSGNDLKTVKWD